jgi:hypothetical protein
MFGAVFRQHQLFSDPEPASALTTSRRDDHLQSATAWRQRSTGAIDFENVPV